jgi:DNA (cytosine-5)-methyltransferase 1
VAKHNAKVSFGSVCSGIEAASCAWGQLGWSADWLSETAPFPSAVLAYRYPDTVNLGDMTQIASRIASGEINAPDLLVGGTPCQAFSIAGLRGGLEDERGRLTLKYVELLDVIDETRTKSGHQPAISVWENVSGVLSSTDNAFGCFIAGLAGEDDPFEPGQRPADGKSSAFWTWSKKAGQHFPKWPKSGCVIGRKRKVAWRTLDAQYFGVAQQRNRVFVVSSSRTDIDPSEILFEREGERRDTPPHRSARQNSSDNATHGTGLSYEVEKNHLIVMAHGQGGAEIKTDGATPTLTCNHEAPIVVTVDPITVRRLTPVECERLQGFPDQYTLIPTAKRKQILKGDITYLHHYFPDITDEEAKKLAADGPRYKALGNSMAVPVMSWIGKRIDDAICKASYLKSTVTHLRVIRAPEEFERPIFKWAGGKFSVMEVLNEHLPHGKRLIEPFVGGGSVFTNAGYKQNLLNDVNGHLINFYKVLQREGHALITLAHHYFENYNTADSFLRIRRLFNEKALDECHLAAAFLYLNRHAFNGLVRYNQSGEFNVGYGKYKAPRFPLEEMEQFLGAANISEFVTGDFAGVIMQAGEGDVIFCDPPYEPLPGKNGFTSYSGHSFGFDEQERLVSLLVAARKRGAKVLITNSGAPKIRELYRNNGFDLHQLQARRSVSCKSGSREMASDILAKLGC